MRFSSNSDHCIIFYIKHLIAMPVISQHYYSNKLMCCDFFSDRVYKKENVLKKERGILLICCL